MYPKKHFLFFLLSFLSILSLHKIAASELAAETTTLTPYQEITTQEDALYFTSTTKKTLRLSHFKGKGKLQIEVLNEEEIFELLENPTFLHGENQTPNDTTKAPEELKVAAIALQEHIKSLDGKVHFHLLTTLASSFTTFVSLLGTVASTTLLSTTDKDTSTTETNILSSMVVLSIMTTVGGACASGFFAKQLNEATDNQKYAKGQRALLNDLVADLV